MIRVVCACTCCVPALVSTLSWLLAFQSSPPPPRCPLLFLTHLDDIRLRKQGLQSLDEPEFKSEQWGEVRVETGVENMRRALQEVGEGMGDTVDEPLLPEVPGDPPGTVDWPQKRSGDERVVTGAIPFDPGSEVDELNEGVV